jgi:hypothetical protein
MSHGVNTTNIPYFRLNNNSKMAAASFPMSDDYEGDYDFDDDFDNEDCNCRYLF